MTMYAYAPDELAQITKGKWHGSRAGQPLTKFCFDARQIEVGDCFVALSGGVRDGHDFVEQAAIGGASAVMVERIVDISLPQLVVDDSLCALGLIGASARARFDGPVVGITGSCGKTSTKEMLRRLLGVEQTHATKGNLNNRIGVPLTLIDLDPATAKSAVVEAGINQPGEMQLLGEMIRADLTIITNIGAAHLELLGSLDGIAVEKARLFQEARPDSHVVFSSELLKYPVFSTVADRAIVLHRSGEPMPDIEVGKWVQYELYPIDGKGPGYELLIGSAKYVVHTSSLGIATNTALGIAAAYELGVDCVELQERIAEWRPALNRGHTLQKDGQFFYVDCYNANPTSMADALDAFDAVAGTQPRAYVLGAMNELGASAVELHESVGKQLKLRPQDQAIFIGPQALSGAYQKGALEAGNLASQLNVCETLENVKSEIAQFQGALFLKGSRSYQLEKLLSNAT